MTIPAILFIGLNLHINETSQEAFWKTKNLDKLI